MLTATTFRCVVTAGKLCTKTPEATVKLPIYSNPAIFLLQSAAEKMKQLSPRGSHFQLSSCPNGSKIYAPKETSSTTLHAWRILFAGLLWCAALRFLGRGKSSNLNLFNILLRFPSEIHAKIPKKVQRFRKSAPSAHFSSNGGNWTSGNTTQMSYDVNLVSSTIKLLLSYKYATYSAISVQNHDRGGAQPRARHAKPRKTRRPL